jgi:hypothetical protein
MSAWTTGCSGRPSVHRVVPSPSGWRCSKRGMS